MLSGSSSCGRGGGHSSVHSATSTFETVSIASEFDRFHDEFKSLYHFVAHLEPPSAASASSFAQSDTFAVSLTAIGPSSNSPQIIDSGASHHMMGMPSLFSTYYPCSSRDKVKKANGSHFLVASKGNIFALFTLLLSNVQHVSKITLNLLSISYITKSLNCSVTFFSSYCVFHDLVTRKTITRERQTDSIMHPQFNEFQWRNDIIVYQWL